MNEFAVGCVWEGFEFSVVDQINSSGCGVAFSPSVLVGKYRSRHTKKIISEIKPLFPEYVFVRGISHEISSAMFDDIKGFVSLVRDGDVIPRIRDSVLIQLVDAELDLFRKEQPKATLIADDVLHKIRFEMKDGAYSGLSGSLQSIDFKKGVATVEMKLFGSHFSVDVSIKSIDMSEEVLEALKKPVQK